MRKNTFDTVIFTWHDDRLGRERELDTSIRRKNMVITNITGIDDWTISREWIGDPETARQIEASHTWEQIAFEITGKIVDDTKQTDAILRAWSKTATIVHMHVVGFEILDRDFYITAFALTRYGNVRDFTISCVDVAGHIQSTLTKTMDMLHTYGKFTFPFQNMVGETFSFGYSVFISQVTIHSDSFIKEEPFAFTCTFSGPASYFTLSNDSGQSLRINYSFLAQDVLTIDMIDSVFTLSRTGTEIPILPNIDYANSSMFGIHQGDQIIMIPEVPVLSARITFVEHLA